MTDLSFELRQDMYLPRRRREPQRLADDIAEWMAENVFGDWWTLPETFRRSARIVFADVADAMMFKLRWF